MAPLVCNYYVTYKCNARCHFCDIWALTPPPEASFETIRTNLIDLRRLGVKYVDFTGGEPLLRPDIVEIYTAAKRLGLLTSLTTNTILYPKKAQQLRGLVDFLNFSLDGPDAASHNQSRGVDLFERLIESVRLARSLGEYPTLNFTVTAQNYERIAEVAELANRLEVRAWLNPAFTAHEHYNNNKNPTPALVAAIRHAAERYRGILGYNKAALALIEAGGNHTADPRCKAVEAVIVISPDDKLLLPCYHFAQHSEPIAGRLFELYSSGEKVAEYRASQGRLSVCEGCTVWCYLIPSFFKGLDRYTLLNGLSYADEFFARRRGRRSRSAATAVLH
ncbi:radical SAM protein [Gloeobacter kilaueensis]|uniref:Radical SAM domain-containing protein n=1 Tax=Gloeobacter kilaueensis (strain ATCC BAA-2537 / CCAP 1431/1 / ULC 316 / JS1) TaxID=1183438 RepID=U5QJU5_GLOK1|nr:radical SAM protein [Gloeobacter kilaueensis]AGY57864.1 radical SAM domain-containing protein [Gloeobacter kilaueensis JS1]